MSSRVSTRTVLIVGAVVALILAGIVSYYASSAPDGLNKVANDQGISKKEKAHKLDDSLFAGYGTEGVDNQRLSGAVAGVAGVAVTFAIVGGLVLAVRRGRREEESASR
jgi:cobalt/nickel transport system permease protein